MMVRLASTSLQVILIKATFFTFCSEPSSVDRRTKLDHKHFCVGSLGEYKYGSLSRLKMGEIPHP